MLAIGAVLSIWAAALAHAAPTPSQTPLTIYTYDSFVAEGGAGPALKSMFEASNPGCVVKYASFGDAVQLVNRLEIERESQSSVIDLVVGIDQNTWPRAQKFAQSDLKNFPQGLGARVSKILPRFKLGDGFFPMDYGPYALIGNFERDPKLPSEISIKDLARSEWKNRFALIDPRTSTPGLAFLAFTHEVLGDREFDGFWRGLREQWFQLAPGWDQVYALFVRGQVSAVWSYVTSEAYHLKKGEKTRRAILFKEGQPVQIEGFFWFGAKRVPSGCALAYGETLLSEAGQRILAERNWMLPVVEGVVLPENFSKLARPKREWVSRLSAEDSSVLLKRWRQTLAR